VQVSADFTHVARVAGAASCFEYRHKLQISKFLVQVAIQSKTDRQNVLKIEKNHNYAMVRPIAPLVTARERA
jgi:hypothetical protein